MMFSMSTKAKACLAIVIAVILCSATFVIMRDGGTRAMMKSINLLRVYTSWLPMIRIGKDNDGGYLLADLKAINPNPNPIRWDLK